MPRHLLSLFLCLSMWAMPAWAHREDISYLTAEWTDQALLVGIDLAWQDVLGEPVLSEQTDAFLEQLGPAAEALAREQILLGVDGRTVRLPPPLDTAIVHRSGGFFVHLDYRLEVKRPEVIVDIRLPEVLGTAHKTLSRVRIDGQPQYGIHDASQPRFRYGTAPEDRVSLSAVALFVSGVEHVLAGPDHLLFLLALLLGIHAWRPLLLTVTAFTVGHSLTLALAVLGLASPPSALVEAGIAASVVIVAAENLLRSKHTHRWPIAAVFGLVHGFGFAGILQEMEMPTHRLWVALPSFNLGVELGQLLALIPAVLVMYLARRTLSSDARKRLSFGISSLVLAVGWYWLLTRSAELGGL